MAKDNNQMGEFERLLQAYKEAQESDDIKLSETIILQLFAIAQEEAERNPTKRGRLIEEAQEHEEAARWEQAEAAYFQALALAETEGIAGMISKSHYDLGRLYEILGKTDNALQQAGAALKSARKANMEPLVLMALTIIFRCHLLKGDVASAAVVADEAVLIMPPDKIYDTQRAGALMIRAQCRLEQHQIAQAGEDLNVVWKILEPRAESVIFAGIRSGLANWWELNARIKTHLKDFGGAAQAMSKAVEIRRTVSELPHISGPYKHYALAEALKEYSVALMAIGENEAAIEAFEPEDPAENRNSNPAI